VANQLKLYLCANNDDDELHSAYRKKHCTETALGVKGVVLQWLKSYLHSRTQTVTIMGEMSFLAELLFGLPQGLVLDPLLFDLYMLRLSGIARQHGVSMHSYTDDTQLYISFEHGPVSHK